MIIDVIIKQSHYEYTHKLLLIQLNQRKIKKIKKFNISYSIKIFILYYYIKIFIKTFLDNKLFQMKKQKNN